MNKIAFSILYSLLIVAGAGSAISAEHSGSTGLYPILIISFISIVILLVKQEKWNWLAVTSWALLSATFFLPFLPGLNGPYPPTRFLFILSAALTFAGFRNSNTDSIKAWHYFFFLAWLVLIWARIFQLDQRLSYGYDLAHVQNILVNTLNGRFLYSDYTGASILTHHPFFTLAALAPIYSFFPYSITIQTIQVILLGIAVLLTTTGVKYRYGNKAAIAAFFAFFLHPSFVGQALHEFDPGVIGTLGISMILFGFGTKNKNAMIAGAVIAAFSKELFAPSIIILSVILAVKDRKNKTAYWLFIIGLIGLASFLTCSLLLEGQMNLKTQFALRMAHHSDSLREGTLFGRIGYLIHLIISQGGISLLGWQFLIPALPEILLNLISRFPMYYMDAHYSTLSLPLISFAAGAGIGYLHTVKEEWAHFAMKYVCSAAILSAIFSNIGPVSHTGAFYDVFLSEPPKEIPALRALIERMPRGKVAVKGQHRLLTLLADRNPVIDLPYIDTSKMFDERNVWVCDEYRGSVPANMKLYDQEGGTLIYVK
ncbi:MAG: hypothetical protein COS94_06460 [Candidatus Hydrogenedentes bacterium CG07_land_8_20_14_0_80_42_17]|nr:MAG: hypothetical protein COS94_06460 [Candidatus Hydrogenedentes bacterium CG07_land_8_20_14_0_80_42_17]